jgi:hypothetical protein
VFEDKFDELLLFLRVSAENDLLTVFSPFLSGNDRDIVALVLKLLA